MRISIAFCTLWMAGLVFGDVEEFKVVCFFENWSHGREGIGNYDIADIDPTQCTHLVYAFVGITGDGDVNVLDKSYDLVSENFRKFVALRRLSPSSKFMVSMGGWNEGTLTYSNVMANASLRSNFVNNVVNFTLRYDFDGFDMDWEYPGQRDGVAADVENFVLLLKELSAEFEERDLILSASVGAPEFCAELSYNIPEISKYVNFINCMTFEYHNSISRTLAAGHNAPLYPAKREVTEYDRSLNVDSSVNYWLNQGAPPEKLIITTPFYGRSFILNNSAENEPGSAISSMGEAGQYTGEAGMLAYYEICERVANESWTIRWDEEQRVPYAYMGNQWISYDNVQSITEKANYIKERGLGGAMVWTPGMDDFRGICGERSPLLKALRAGLASSAGADRAWTHFSMSLVIATCCFCFWCRSSP